MRRPENLGIVESPDRLARWLTRLQGRGTLAVDTEHTGFRWERDRIGGLCLAANRTALYATRDALGPATRWLADQVKRRRPLAFHAAKGDLLQLRGTFGLYVDYPVDDTVILSFLVDNRGVRGRHKLKPLAARYVDPAAEEPETRLREAVVAAGGSRKKDEWKADILLGPPQLVGEYGAMDAWYTLRLREILRDRLDGWRQPDPDAPALTSLYETERWLTLALVDLEQRGVLADPEFFESWKRQLETKLAKIERRLARYAGRCDVNWNSAPQIRELIYGKLKQLPTGWTKGGEPSTDEVALTKLKHPIGALLLTYRELEKQRGTYAVGLLAAVRADGRIHGNFKQTGARTGRMSCTDPNLQQVTRESGARRGFKPDPGTVFRFADYSQIEMRFGAHYSNDPTLVAGFCEDPNFDTHAATAMRMWGMRSLDPDGNKTHARRRKYAKIINFLILFGGGVNKLTSQLMTMLSADDARRSLRELRYRTAPGETPHQTLATKLMDRYFAEFPAVRGAKYREQDLAERWGFAVNAFGRHRYLDETEIYKAFNTVVQGSAADQAKRGFVALYRELERRDRVIALTLQIHDEAVYLSDGDPRTDRRVIELLNDETSFRVPIVADVSGSATTWQDKEKIKL